MKPKEESTPKYPDPGYEMYSNFRNNHQKTEKNKEERKRLKVFSNLSSVPPLSKKIDQRVITKEISKENNRDPETRFKQEFALEGFEDDANSHQQYNYQDSNIYQQDTIGRIRHENSVGQSLPSFSSEFDRARQITQKEKTSEVLNKSFNDVNMGASSFLASSPNDASMQFGLNQSHNANVFEQRDMSQDTKAFSSLPRSNPGIKSLKDNSRRGRREFFPSNRLNRGGMTFGKKSGNKNSSESDRTPDRKKPAQWGLKVDKINPSVGKIRKPDFLKKPSREIMISGVSSRELS